MNDDRELLDRTDTDGFDAALEHEGNFTLSLPFQKASTAADAQDISFATETAQLAILLRSDDHGGTEVSAGIAEQARISRPTPPVFLPAMKHRKTRSTLTIVVSLLTVLALVAVGVLFALKSQEVSPEQKAFDAYAARQLTVATADRKLTTTFKAIGTARTEADAVNLASAAALAAVAGVSDETARAAADAQRIASAEAIAAVSVDDPADTPYTAPVVSTTSSLTVIAAGLDEVSAEANRIDDAQLALDAALTEISDARSAFTAAFAAFADTFPVTVPSLLGANPDAGQEWRDAVGAAAAAFTAAVERGAGATELQAYAAAAFALQDENARVLLAEAEAEAEAAEREAEEEEDAPRQAPTRPRTPTPDTNSPPPVVEPEPNPVPEPDPAPEPEPDPLPEGPITLP